MPHEIHVFANEWRKTLVWFIYSLYSIFYCWFYTLFCLPKTHDQNKEKHINFSCFLIFFAWIIYEDIDNQKETEMSSDMKQEKSKQLTRKMWTHKMIARINKMTLVVSRIETGFPLFFVLNFSLDLFFCYSFYAYIRIMKRNKLYRTVVFLLLFL